MLEVRDLRALYGPIEALRGVDIDVREGEFVAIIGPNGAGKSTLLKTLCGIHRLAGGSIKFLGAEIAGLPAHAVVSAGIMLVPEGRRLFGDQTVLDNLLLGGFRRRPAGGIPELRVMGGTFLDRFPILRERRDQLSGSLSGGQQQMLAISRGLMARPRLLLLDEPSLGLAPLMVREVFSMIKRLRSEGTTILLVEQMASLALKLSDRAYVLERGRVLLEGLSRELLRDQRVLSGYLGGSSG